MSKCDAYLAPNRTNFYQLSSKILIFCACFNPVKNIFISITMLLLSGVFGPKYAHKKLTKM